MNINFTALNQPKIQTLNILRYTMNKGPAGAGLMSEVA